MSEQDFRQLMADLETAETERDILREMLKAEREKQDEYSDQVSLLQVAMEEERNAWRMQMNDERRKTILWGVIGLGAGALFAN